jgi:uncharacterized heparinase superfamily protein
MSLLERIDASGEPEIQQGKRLIRVGDDRNFSLAERLAYGINRLAWRMPFSNLRLRGRFPLKLVAVPKDPVAGDRSAGEALLQGRMVQGNDAIELEGLDLGRTDLSPALYDYLHSFAWLRDLASVATREKGGRLGERLMRLWLESCSLSVEDPSWRHDLWGRRILFWTAYAPYILSTRDMIYRSTLLNTLARGARHLERGADRARPGLGRVSAWGGAVASAVLVQGGLVRLSRAESGLMRALGEAMHDDGGLVSRSPVEQVALVELLGQLRAVYIAGHRELPERLQDALGSAVSALLGVTLGDEALSSWQGGNMASKRLVAAAVEGSGVRARPLRQARGWGYQRLANKQAVILFDGAPPPPSSRSISGGCASTLAFEFSDGAERIVVNCGGAGLWTGQMSPALAHALRYTAAHSTLTLGDRNSTAILQDGTLGKGVGQVEISRDETAGIARVEGSHDGYVRRFGLIHERRLILAADGRELRGDDNLTPKKRRRRGAPIPFAVRFHLGPSVEAATTADGQGALLRIRGGSAWQFRCRGGVLGIEDSLWVDGSGRMHATSQLVITGETPSDGMAISWLFRRAA